MTGKEEMEKGLSRNALKYIAIVAMVIDHVGMEFIPITTIPGCCCRIVGRLTAPLMCLFLAEGYAYTSSRKKYGLRLLIFGLISQFPYALMHYGTTIKEGETALSTILKSILNVDFNVIITLFLSFLTLYVYDLVPGYNRRCILMGLLIGASMVCDWGLVAPLLAIVFHTYRENKNQQVKWFSVVAAGQVAMSILFCISANKNWYGELWQLGLYMVIPFIYLYNGKPGCKHAFHKWFFYLFYPLHMVAIWAIKFYMV